MKFLLLIALTLYSTIIFGQTVSDVDGNIYNTVIIRNRLWMKENLRTTHFNDGKPIPLITDSLQWRDDTFGAYCDYNNDPKNGGIFGHLYNAYAVDNPSRICPEGWHIPRPGEWDTLLSIDGCNLIKHDVWPLNSCTEYNSSGFSAIPTGYRGSRGGNIIQFLHREDYTNFWASDPYLLEYPSSFSQYMQIQMGSYPYPVTNLMVNKNRGFSCRCVMDSPVVTTKVNLINPYPSMVKTDGSIETSVSTIDMSKVVFGTVCDGISKLLLVTESDVPLTFSLPTYRDGGLSSLTNQNSAPQVTIEPEDGKVVAIYTPPDGYGKNNPPLGRIINIKVSYGLDNTGDVAVNLETPPVVLVHGMWSDPNMAWLESSFKDKLRDFEIELADYSKYNHITFDPENPQSKQATDILHNSIVNALTKKLNKGIVATQVDIVAHSLGALVTRSYSQNKIRFLRPVNYNKGFIHKLISIGSPHLGSNWGPLLYESNQKLAMISSLLGLGLEYLTVSEILQYVSDKKIGSVHEDFNPDFKNTGKGIDNLDSNLFKVHAICARWDKEGVEVSEGAFEELAQILKGEKISAILKDDIHDIIVPLYSQKGGLTNPNHFDVFDSTEHVRIDQIGETENTQIQERTKSLLLSDGNWEFADGFPSAKQVPTPFDHPLEEKTTHKKNKTLSANDYTLKITSPKKPFTYINNGNDSITFTLDFSDPSKLANVILMIGNVKWIALPASQPLTSKLVLPVSLSSGILNIAALANDFDGNIYADTLSITIHSNDTLFSIKTNPAKIELDSNYREAKFTVIGHYKNGLDTTFRNISTVNSGTTYSAKNNSNILSIENDGIVKALKPGVDTIIIKNGELADSIPVTIDSSLFLVQKFKSDIQFLIDDKTVNDPPFVLDAKATSGQYIKYELLNGPVKLMNNIVVIDSSGLVSIKATSQGNAYFDSVSVTGTFFISNNSIFKFTGNGNWSDPTNWLNLSKPPINLLKGSEIIIEPIEGGECILDSPQIISKGAFLKIKSGKKFVISADLNFEQ